MATFHIDNAPPAILAENYGLWIDAGNVRADGKVPSIGGTMAKPGWKCSEFWLTTALHVAATAIVTGLVPAGGVVVQVAALALSALSQLGYTSSRAYVKVKTAPK